MSDDNVPDTEVRLETDLLELRKRASRSSTEYPVFEYRIDYHGSPPGELTLTESLPPGIDADDVEFHPDFHGENWTCDGETATFEYILPDAEVVETKFGLSVDDRDVVEAVLSAPDVVVDDLETGDRIAAYDVDDAESVAADDDGMTPVEPDPVSDTVREIIMGSESPVDGESSPADVEEPIAAAPGGDVEAVAGTEGDVAAESTDDDAEADVEAVGGEVESPDDPVVVEDGDSEDDAETADREATTDDVGSADDAGDDGEAAAAPETADEPAEAETGADETAEGATTDAESVGTALAAELRAGTIPEDDLAVLRDHLDVGPSESEAVRLRDLQARYHDLEAYTNALRAFVDENGDADGVLADLQSDLASVEADVEDLSSAADRIDRVEERLDDYPAADDLVDRLDGVAADLDDAERTLHERLGELEERLSALESTVADVEEQTEVLLELQDVFGGSN